MDIIFDIEGDSLNPTKIHCLSYRMEKNDVETSTDYDEMRNIISKATRLIGHNITRFDIPVLERILDIKIECELVDTLALSWYIYPNRIMHGLEEWGEYFGVPKPKIDDWENLPIEEYIRRCTEDVKINTNLWNKMKKDLLEIYEGEEQMWRIIRYLQYKMDCALEQERSKWLLDIPHTTSVLEELSKKHQEITEALEAEMPQVPKKAKRTRPAKPFKLDGTYSVVGAKWFKLLKEQGLAKDYDGPVEVITHYEPPKASSHIQIKSWLFSLGWDPASFKYEKDDFGNERTIPQVRIEGDSGKELCPSVLLLKEKCPAVGLLESISILQHRIGILEGFLSAVDDNGYVTARISGLTNTLRFKHKELVNLPGIDKPYGKEIRACLIAPEGYELCGSDMSSLEDRTKQHYMWDHDPEYVKEMNTEDFDPHLDLAVLAKMLTQQQVDAHKAKKENHGPVRKKAKTTNYSATYGIRPLNLSRKSGMSVKEASELLDTFWKRNWSLQAIADGCKVKTINGQMWLYNPVSKFWLSLRYEKDKFSTLNQSTGVYCFDCWVREIRKVRPQLTAQFHDEVVLCVKKGHREKAKELLLDAIHKVNKRLGLNRDLGIDIQFGDNYAQIH